MTGMSPDGSNTAMQQRALGMPGATYGTSNSWATHGVVTPSKSVPTAPAGGGIRAMPGGSGPLAAASQAGNEAALSAVNDITGARGNKYTAAQKQAALAAGQGLAEGKLDQSGFDRAIGLAQDRRLTAASQGVEIDALQLGNQLRNDPTRFFQKPQQTDPLAPFQEELNKPVSAGSGGSAVDPSLGPNAAAAGPDPTMRHDGSSYYTIGGSAEARANRARRKSGVSYMEPGQGR